MTTCGISSCLSGIRRCSPNCAMSLSSRERTCSGSCTRISRSCAAAGISGPRYCSVPAKPSTSAAAVINAAVSRITSTRGKLDRIANSGIQSLLRSGAFVHSSRDTRANSSKDGDAKPPVYGFRPMTAGCRPAGTVSRIEPAGQRRRLQRPPSRVRFVDFDHPWGVLCGERVGIAKALTILFARPLIYSGAGA